jgi:arginyl-tRNA synthetase
MKYFAPSVKEIPENTDQGMKTELKEIIKDSIDDCFRRGLLKETPLPEYVIEVPNRSEHGHFATNLPLALASSQKRAPRDIASIIVDHLRDEQGLIEQAEVAGHSITGGALRAKTRVSWWNS